MPNKIYRALETPVVFRDSGGDRVLALQNLAGSATADGQISAQYDRGAGSQSQLHEVIGVFQFETAPQLGEAVEIYLYQSDGTYVDGNVGTVSATLPAAKNRNGLFVGAVTVDTTSTATDIVARFTDVPISSRYYSVGVFNRVVSDNLRNVANTSRIIVTPQPPEIQ